MPIKVTGVLIVDDEVTEIATIRRVLETDKAFRIFTAANYHEAVKISQAHCAEIDLALLDVTLPGTNGVDLAKHLLSVKPHLRVLFMSSSVGASVLRACGLEARDEYFLHKPFDATAIEAAVDTSDVVLALLTPASYRSEICRAEQLRSLRKGKCLIPLLAVAGSDVPLHLEPKNYRDFTTEDTYAAGFQDLLRDVAELNGPR